MQRFDDDDDDTIRIDILFLVASIVVWNQSGVTFSISLRCRDARWHRWLVELFSIPTPSFPFGSSPFFFRSQARFRTRPAGEERMKPHTTAIISRPFVPPASSPDDSISPAENVSFKRARDCGLAHHQFYFFSWGSVSNHWIVRRRRAAAAAKGAWNISLDISQAAYIVFFFFLNTFFFLFLLFYHPASSSFFPFFAP